MVRWFLCLKDNFWVNMANVRRAILRDRPLPSGGVAMVFELEWEGDDGCEGDAIEADPEDTPIIAAWLKDNSHSSRFTNEQVETLLKACDAIRSEFSCGQPWTKAQCDWANLLDKMETKG